MYRNKEILFYLKTNVPQSLDFEEQFGATINGDSSLADASG